MVAILSKPQITGTVGGTLTVVPGGTTDAVSVSYQWYRDLLPIAGATGTTLDGAAWPGTINVVETATGAAGDQVSSISDGFVNGTNSVLILADDFNGTVNDLLSQRPGWTVNGGTAAEQSQFKVRAAGSELGIATVTSTPPATVNGMLSYAVAHFDVGAANQALEIDNNPGGIFWKAVFWYRDESNFCYIAIGGTTVRTLTVHQVVNGVDTAITGKTCYVPIGSGQETLRFEIAGGVVSVKYRNGGETAFTSYSFGNTQVGTPVPVQGNQGQALTAASGTHVGILGGNTATNIVNAFRGYSIDVPLALINVTSDTISNVPTYTINASYTGATPSGFDVGVMLTDGTQIVSRTAATIVSAGGGSAVLTLSAAALRAAEGKTAIVQLWFAGEDVGNTRSFAMPVYQTVFPYEQGINEGFLKQGKPVDVFRDLYFSGNWRKGGGYLFPDAGQSYSANGFPTNYPAGFSSWNMILPNPADTTSDRLGNYIITVPPGMSVTGYKSSSPAPTVTPNGDGTFTYVHDASTSHTITISGPIPASGGYCHILKQGDPHPERTITDAAAGSLGALGTMIRAMSPRWTNDMRYKAYAADGSGETQFTAADRIIGPVPDFGLSVELQVAMCNEAGANMYHNATQVGDAGYQRSEAQAAAANLHSSARVEIEIANEVWNSGFYAWGDFALQGVRRGFADGSVNAAVDATPLPVLSNFNNVHTGNSDTTFIGVPPAASIFMEVSGIGFAVWKNISGSTIAAGATIPFTTDAQGHRTPTSDGNWQLVYDNVACSMARQRYLAYFSAFVWDIWDDEFRKAGRAVPLHILGAQTGGSVSASVQQALEFLVPFGGNSRVPLYSITDKLHVAPYWFTPGSPIGNLGDYTAPDWTGTHPWTQAIRNQVGTEAFRSAFFAVAYDAVDYAVNNQKNYKHSLANYCVSKGLSPDAIKMGSYEANWHVQFGNWPASLLSTANAEFGVLMRDSRFGAVSSYYASQLAAKVGGVHCVFDRIGPIPTLHADNPVPVGESCWSLQEGEWDNATSGSGQNYRYTAFANARNGIF